MLLRHFTNAELNVPGSGLKHLGIMEYKRTIYIFVEPQFYNLKTAMTGKAAIVNRCVYKSDSPGNIIHDKHDNSAIIRNAIYFCDIQFEIPSDIFTVSYMVDTGFIRERETVKSEFYNDDNLTLNFEPTRYSLRLNQAVKEPSLINETVNEWVRALSPTEMIPPEYYTEYHMFKSDVGDYYSLHDGEVRYCVNSQDIHDDNTHLYVIDIGLYDTMKTEILNKLYNNDLSVKNNFDISAELNSSFEGMVGEQGIFIYDSQAKDIPNNSKVYIKGGHVPLKDYYHQKFLKSNLKCALDAFYHRCKDIENSFGSIRVLCQPNFVGNSMKIRFKDYNYDNQPIKKLDINNKNVSTIDSGYIVSTSIDDVIDMFEEDNVHPEGAFTVYPVE